MTEKHENIKLGIYSFSIFILYVLYFFAFIGVIYIDKHKIHLFSIIIQIAICLVLMLRFHPFTHHEITYFDKTLIFSAASFLAINIFMTEIYTIYIHESMLLNNESWKNIKII